MKCLLSCCAVCEMCDTNMEEWDICLNQSPCTPKRSQYSLGLDTLHVKSELRVNWRHKSSVSLLLELDCPSFVRKKK